jgi:hypothetical protein
VIEGKELLSKESFLRRSYFNHQRRRVVNEQALPMNSRLPGKPGVGKPTLGRLGTARNQRLQRPHKHVVR